MFSFCQTEMWNISNDKVVKNNIIFSEQAKKIRYNRELRFGANIQIVSPDDDDYKVTTWTAEQARG